MGDAADDALDRMMDVDEFEQRMEHEDEDMIIDDESCFPVVFSRSVRPKVLRCRFCHAGPFVWKETEAGWRLATAAGEIHSCEAYRAKEPR